MCLGGGGGGGGGGGEGGITPQTRIIAYDNTRSSIHPTDFILLCFEGCGIFSKE